MLHVKTIILVILLNDSQSTAKESVFVHAVSYERPRKGSVEQVSLSERYF